MNLFDKYRNFDYIHSTHVYSLLNYLGGSDTTMELLNAGTLFKPHTSEHDYDLVVIGGGSGGLACAKEASRLGF